MTNVTRLISKASAALHPDSPDRRLNIAIEAIIALAGRFELQVQELSRHLDALDTMAVAFGDVEFTAMVRSNRDILNWAKSALAPEFENIRRQASRK